MQAKELLTSPFAAISTILTFLADLAGFLDPLLSVVWSTVGTWYPAVAISSSTLVPMVGTVRVPYIGLVDPTGLAQQVTIVGALIYVAYLLDSTIDRATENTEK